jgi:hypothetical protein
MKFLLALLLGALNSPDYIDTRIDDYSYSITFIERRKESFQTSKHSALVYAAKLGNQKSFNYFTLDSIEHVTVTLSQTEIFPGLKLFITYYYDKPASGEIYEVCNLIFCR